ncbi:MAG: response regulator [Desulfobacterales bacterium]|nr:response regulator [Desulfobacterales bacterium]MBF0395372.1 response regulator [Desulfobacterales bacterium]
MKIIVVDDEKIVLDSCRKVLTSEGFDVEIISSSDEALKKLKIEEPVLLIIDVKMPGHDGIYLLKEVRKITKSLPVIVMSGYHTKETINESTRFGASIFLYKPFTPEELIAAIYKVIKKEENK